MSDLTWSLIDDYVFQDMDERMKDMLSVVPLKAGVILPFIVLPMLTCNLASLVLCVPVFFCGRSLL